MRTGGGSLDAGRAVLPVILTGLGLTALVAICTGVPCVPTGVQYGVWTSRCPATDLRASALLQLEDLARGRWGRVEVMTTAHWLDSASSSARERDADVPGADILLDLVDAGGEIAGALELREADWSGGRLRVEVRLPEVPDGDYRLRATVDAGFETVTVEADLPLFAPALVHVVADRPLYEADQTVLLRAAVIARADGVPIAGRPGRWRIVDPSGQELLLEDADTDDWGVASTSFPLSVDAVEGTWQAFFTTGGDERRSTFDVRPFTLPRFTVEARSEASWYRMNDRVVLTGAVRYTSGAPVQDAAVDVRLMRTEGRWPLPLAWEEPLLTRTGTDGSFRVDLGPVPADLMERARIMARVGVVEATGERQAGTASFVVSEDPLYVEAVTAFDGGLVADLNNRAYLRVMTPDGRPLRDATLTVANPYDATAPETTTTTDVDGVAALQLDPGEPVSIVVPPPPSRIRPFAPGVPQVVSMRVHPGGRGPSLGERRALDTLHGGIARCGELAIGSVEVAVGLQIGPSGQVDRVQGPTDVLGRCVTDVMAAARFPPGDVRTAALTWRVPDALLPSLGREDHPGFGNSGRARDALAEQALLARRCLTRGVGQDGAVVGTVHWTAATDAPIQTRVALTGQAGLDAATRACLTRTLGEARLAKPLQTPAMGATTLQLSVPRPPGSTAASATTTTGFQLAVRAEADGEAMGQTTVTLPVGTLPPLRLRTTPALADVGATLVVELLRGPSYRGDLPEELTLRRGSETLATARVDPAARQASFTLPADVDGFLAVEGGGARSFVFIRPADPLTVTIASDAARYRPGETATLTVTTRSGETPVEASVTLAGVDATLAQLVPLTPTDDWGDVTVLASGSEAFGTFGPRALQLGLVRGQNAARAAVLTVEALGDDEGPGGVYGSAVVEPEVEEALTTGFYRGLEALVARVRAWEGSAPADEELTPAVVARLWSEVLAEAAATEAPLIDGYGRTLELTTLPADLLQQVDPQQVVGDSTRLPEDVLNWPAWVEVNL